MIHILKSCVHEQLIRIKRVKLSFGNTVTIVINKVAPFWTAFGKTEKMGKEKDVLKIIDQNCLWNQLVNFLKRPRIQFIQMNKLYLVL